MNKIFLLLIGACFFSGCGREPFVEHKLKFEKKADDCTEGAQPFRMTSNFGGERYQFGKCLPANFDKEQMNTTRKGDTVVVSFPNVGEGASRAMFDITLDIDSYPRYNYITIDGDTYAIVAAN